MTWYSSPAEQAEVLLSLTTGWTHWKARQIPEEAEVDWILNHATLPKLWTELKATITRPLQRHSEIKCHPTTNEQRNSDSCICFWTDFNWKNVLKIQICCILNTSKDKLSMQEDRFQSVYEINKLRVGRLPIKIKYLMNSFYQIFH